MKERENENDFVVLKENIKHVFARMETNPVAKLLVILGSALFLLLALSRNNIPSFAQQQQQHRSLRLLSANEGATAAVKQEEVNRTRILYIITSSQEYNDGSRATKHGQDRLMEVVMPVILEGVESMVAASYDVDVYLVLAYTLRPDRQQRVQDMLPPGVGLEVWSDAEPLSYDWPKTEGKSMVNIDRALARQHRFVVRDKFPYYDLFVVFEDDMLVTSSHIRYHLSISAELDKLREHAPEELPENMTNSFHGPLTKIQIARMTPGFIRVEVLLNETQYPSQKEVDQVPIDHNFTNRRGTKEYHADVDPEPCCHVRHIGLNGTLAPPTPRPDQLMVWETGIRGMSLRKLPRPSRLKWVAFLTGPSGREKLKGYWAGSNGVLPKSARADDFDPNFLANAAGWLATRPQIMEKHERLCEGGFLPPFDKPAYPYDGLQANNVEFWSGGIQMWCGKCNIQRILPVDPGLFSRALMYHTANNKQRVIKQQRLVKVNHLLGQINSAKKAAAAWKFHEKHGESV